MKTEKNIAIVYDWIDKWGGVERVLLTLHTLFPSAKLYTSYYDKNKAKWARNITIVPSFVNRLPIIRSSRILSFILYPFAFESFDFSAYDIVITVSSSFAKSIITKPGTRHLCYLLTPTRYVWVSPEKYVSFGVRRIFAPFWNYIKAWDHIASNRPDKIITLSRFVSKRILKVYEKKAEVVYPPFELSYWRNIKKEVQNKQITYRFKLPQTFFLVVSRLEPYKRVDLLVNTFNSVKKELVIVGKGSQYNRLKAIAGKTIHFLQDISDRELAFLYKQAQAVIMPQEEDFGYVAVEAQFMGCPILSYSKSGVSEIIIDKKTGLLFTQQSIESIIEVLERFDQISYNLKRTTVQYGEGISKKFESSLFKKNLLHILQLNL